MVKPLYPNLIQKQTNKSYEFQIRTLGRRPSKIRRKKSVHNGVVLFLYFFFLLKYSCCRILWKLKVYNIVIHNFLVILHLLVSSVAQLYTTLCDPMDHSTPGLPVHHKFPEFTQAHVHRVDDAIEPSHPLLSPSPPAFNLSQHQGLSQ